MISESSLRERFERIWPYLCSKNVIIRIENIAIQCVSEQNTKRDSLQHLFKQKKILSNDLSCSKISFISFFHLEFSSYFFQASNAYPCRNLVNFIFFKFHNFSTFWFNIFYLRTIWISFWLPFCTLDGLRFWKYFECFCKKFFK